MKPTEKDIITMMSDVRTAEKGLRAMMDTYQSRLYWHIRRLVVEHPLAQEILQDTFIKAYKNIHQFNENSKLFTWLYRIATNEALQQIAKLKKMQKTDENAEELMQNLVASNMENDAEGIQILLQNAIQTLPEKQKLVFTMRYYDDLPYEEMSEILQMSVATLKTNYHYAKQKIEQYIRDNYDA
ncbi:MAG: RNA polymerase sigma factor [Bergeyella zoohelcum]|nr:RNA polymerase sigma factor [Bergeyella zoohelcum]